MVNLSPVPARFQAAAVDAIASDGVEAIDVTCRPFKAVVITWDPAQDASVLYSNAAAADLIPRLEAMLERLKSGSLRLPVDDGVRWVDEGG
jgi:trans-aconitate methyltransferase